MSAHSNPRGGHAAAVGAVIRLSVQQLLRSRRTLVFGLLGAFPPAFATLFAIVQQIPKLQSRVLGFEVFSYLMYFIYLQVFLIGVALFYGTALINEEVEDRTLTYLLLRPTSRRVIVMGKYLTYLLTAALLLLPSVVLTYVILEGADGFRGIGRHLPYLMWDLGVMTLGAMAYGALFAFLGTALKRPAMFGLAFVIVWEVLVTYVPGRFSRFTILHYLLSLFPHSTVQRGVQTLFGFTTSRSLAVVALLLISGAFLVLAMEVFGRREYVLEQ
jgi:ABC-2 type transport system permease protein